MMATTHAYAGLAIVAPIAYAVPEFGLPLAIGALVGGVAPDLDLVFDHRRTLHFPVYGGAVAIPAIALATLAPSGITAAIAAFALAAWVHAASDALGSGPEMDPWKNPREEAVYDHFGGRWVRARKYVRYDGAPEDFALGAAFAVPALVVFDGPIRVAIVAGLVPALGYTVFRRRIADWAPEWLE